MPLAWAGLWPRFHLVPAVSRGSMFRHSVAQPAVRCPRSSPVDPGLSAVFHHLDVLWSDRCIRCQRCFFGAELLPSREKNGFLARAHATLCDGKEARSLRTRR
ncbi:hypothetical protein BDN67DRAFT_976348 [Paxillus ammoniavirescens]|nr:hypothetical protein BDN67DRAFT_976348 [Paxillus ammoniavirescens]